MRVGIKKEVLDINNNDIKWHLLEEQLWITRYDRYGDVERHLPDLCGSFNWLYEVNDTMLFEKKTGTFQLGIIDLSGKMIVLKDSIQKKYCEMTGNIFIAENKNCDFEFSQKVKYIKTDDCLLCESVNRKASESTKVVFLTSDFGFLISNDLLCGWILKNASEHIYLPDGQKILGMNEADSYDRELLCEYLSLLRQWEEDEQETDDLKKLWMKVEKKSDGLSLSVKECLANILEIS